MHRRWWRPVIWSVGRRCATWRRWAAMSPMRCPRQMAPLRCWRWMPRLRLQAPSGLRRAALWRAVPWAGQVGAQAWRGTAGRFLYQSARTNAQDRHPASNASCARRAWRCRSSTWLSGWNARGIAYRIFIWPSARAPRRRSVPVLLKTALRGQIFNADAIGRIAGSPAGRSQVPLQRAPAERGLPAASGGLALQGDARRRRGIEQPDAAIF